MTVSIVSKQFYSLGWFYHALNRYAHKTIPGVRIRLLQSIVVLERRVASKSRRDGKWVRLDRTNRPSNARQWGALGKKWFKIASSLTTAIKWNGTSGRCFNRCRVISQGRGRLVRSLPRGSPFLTGVDYERKVS